MTKSDKITVLAEIEIIPGNEKEILSAAKDIVIATRKEPGCEAFLFNLKKNKSNTIVFVEVFKSQLDFDIHRNEQHTNIFLNLLKGRVVADGPRLTFLDQFED